MGGQITREIVSVLLAIVTLGIVATLVSKNATTVSLVNSGSSAFNTAIATAQGPVTGYSPGAPIYTNQNNGGVFGNFSGLATLGGLNGTSYGGLGLA